jgi:DHA1 family multidrug resistance protein-like MFS transporter
MSRDFLLVIISLITWGICEGAFMYFQPLYLEELGASPLAIGGILGAVGLAMTVVHIPAGFLADRIGRRQIMWGAWLMGIVTTGIMAGAKNLLTFSIGIILYSLTVFVIAPLNSYVTSARKNLSVEQAMTGTSAAFYLGGILGPLLGGYLANQFGLRSIYSVSFGIFILSGLIILFIKPQPVETKSLHPGLEIIKNKRFMGYLPLLFLTFLVLFFPQPLAPNFLKNQREISLGTIGILGSITNLGNVVLNLLFGILPTRLGLVIGQLAVATFSLLVWKSTGMPLLVAGYFLLGGYRAVRSLLAAQAEKLVAPANLGLAYGFTETVAGLSLMAASPLAGALYSRDPSLIFSVSLFLVSPLIISTLIRRRMPWNI